MRRYYAHKRHLECIVHHLDLIRQWRSRMARTCRPGEGSHDFLMHLSSSELSQLLSQLFGVLQDPVALSKMRYWTKSTQVQLHEAPDAGTVASDALHAGLSWSFACGAVHGMLVRFMHVLEWPVRMVQVNSDKAAPCMQAFRKDWEIWT